MTAITEKERKILYSLELEAETPISEVSKNTRAKGHTLRYALSRLIDNNVISKRAFINIYPLGFADYAIYFSLASDKQSTKDALLDYLARSEFVSWLAFFGGEFQYGMAISAQTGAAVQQFLEEISATFPGIFFHKSLSLRLSLTLISRKYLLSGNQQPKTIHFGYGSKTTTIDQKDHLILSSLESYSDWSLRELSLHIKMPLTTLQQRIASLKKRGILEGSIYQVDATKFGMQTFRFLIETKSIDRKTKQALYDFALNHPFICYYIECLGSWDYELGVEVPLGSNAIDTQQEIYKKFGSELISVTILPLFGHLKLKNYPFKNFPPALQ
jgi:DNA-binding Lrp family transcriptional regulator